jgi:Leucine-rich repeat (LRR) protein
MLVSCCLITTDILTSLLCWLYVYVVIWCDLGDIPPEIGALNQLTALYISDNFLTSSIPNALSAMTSMQKFECSGNRLTGAIPMHVFRHWPELAYLRMVYNQFTKTIPAELGDMTNIYSLSLYQNQLSGLLSYIHQMISS